MSGTSIGILRRRSDLKTEESSTMAVHYLEIVSNDVETLTGLYQRIHGLSFGPPDPDLGQARVATGADGTLVGIRKPLAGHEQPIMRTYLAVDDIQQAVKKAEEHGASVAYPPTRQGQRGTFAIVIQGDAQYGLWQR
jgi:predicted enzyme related to lactoylglutathione lyase